MGRSRKRVSLWLSVFAWIPLVAIPCILALTQTGCEPASYSHITYISIVPYGATMNYGAQQQFFAYVDGNGDYTGKVTWSAQYGSITAAGLYTAPASGATDVVKATSAEDRTVSETVTIKLPGASSTVTSVAVSPASATLAFGATQQFSASVTGTNSPSQQVTWSATHGSITASGLYTAPASGTTDTVTATSVADTSMNGTATITLQATAPAVSSVAVSPASATLAFATTQQFSATVHGSNSPSQSVTWSARNGSITTSGLYTAPASGTTDTVTATSVADTSVSGTSSITLQAAAATVTSVTVSPTPEAVPFGSTQQFSATVTGTNNPSQLVTWSAVNGSITSLGLYTAPASGNTDTVTATSVADTSVSGTAAITLQTWVVVVSPASANVAFGATQQFSATVNGPSNPHFITWSALHGSINASGLYTAPASGTTDTVTARDLDTSTIGTATITLNQ